MSNTMQKFKEIWNDLSTFEKIVFFPGSIIGIAIIVLLERKRRDVT